MARPTEAQVSHRGDDRFVIRLGPHEVTVDQPFDNGGTDTAPTPTELFIGSYAACIAFYARRFLHRHGLDEAIAVRASWETTNRPHRVSRIGFEISADVPPELQGRFISLVHSCTVGNTLRDAPEVSLKMHPLSPTSLPIEVARVDQRGGKS